MSERPMNLSHISLRNPDPDKIRSDPGAKTLSFFCLHRPVLINADTIGELKTLSSENGNANVRICLHESPQANHHDMIILERAGKYYRPHLHPDKGEAFHIIEGQMGLFAFDANGNVLDAVVLNKGDIYRVEAGMHHALLPITDPIIYHENKPGPFLGDSSNLYPEWAPDGTNSDEVSAYVSELKSKLKM